MHCTFSRGSCQLDNKCGALSLASHSASRDKPWQKNEPFRRGSRSLTKEGRATLSSELKAALSSELKATLSSELKAALRTGPFPGLPLRCQ